MRLQCPFSRVAVVNRGEAAMRAIHAVHELGREQRRPIAAVALYTEPDYNAMFVRQADIAVPLGPATFVDRDGAPKNSYLDYERLERALVESGADAAWVGWGFVAEHAQFAELCERLGVVFVGPSPEAMRRLGDKITSKHLAEEADVPVAPWSGGPVASLEEANQHAERIGYPLMVKATAGGGGRGIRRVYEANALARAVESASAEAHRSFGDPTVFLERLLPASRHIEVQVIADDAGTAWAAGVRDCTIQRRNQKVVEESASTALTDAQDREIREAAVRLCTVAGYTNAGTVEFLYDTASRRFSFMEVNARLQVEHPVTEETTGLDLVKLQLHVAGGGRLEGVPPAATGHAVEVRLNAEDPDADFAPAPGVVELLRLPTGPGIRVDAGVSGGDVIPVEFDSMIAKLIAWGRDRVEALARLTCALDETEVVVRGGATNRSFLLALLQRSEVLAGDVEVGWLDQLAAADQHVPRDHAEVALVQAAVEGYDAERAAEVAQFFAMAARGRAQTRPSVGHAVDLRMRGCDYHLDVRETGPSLYRVMTDGHDVEVDVQRVGRFERRITARSRTHRVLSVVDGASHMVEVDGVAHRISRDTGGVVRAPAPAVVAAVLVQPGEQVAAGDRLVLLEAMKTEMAIVAPMDGTVAEVLVTPNVQVAAGAPLVELQPLERESDRKADERVDLGVLNDGDRPDVGPERRCRSILDALRRQMLGFDIDPAYSRALVLDYGTSARQLRPGDPALAREEEAVLDVFADVCSLAGTVPDPDALPGEEAHSSREDLLVYLRSIRSRAEGLPPSFVVSLRRCLAHYGVHDLDVTPQLRGSLFWMTKAQERLPSHLPAIQSILDRRLEQADGAGAPAGDSFREILDRLVVATQRRFPDVASQAREVRYQCFERPELEARADRTYAGAADHLAALDHASEQDERTALVTALVECPQPLKNQLTSRFLDATAGRRRNMLEVLTLRYYRVRDVDGLAFVTSDGEEFATAHYDHDGRRTHVVTTFARYESLDTTLLAMRPMLAQVAPGHDVVVDLYVWRPKASDDDATSGALLELIERSHLPHTVRRLVVAISAPGHGRGMAGTQHFTFRPRSSGGYGEDRLQRGFHPMMGNRLRLQHLGNFRLQRLPSAEDVYLFSGVAHENPADERLFVLVEVRDVSPVRDESGRARRLPGLEWKLSEALAAMRAEHIRRPPEARSHMNRVVLYVWPVLDLDRDELREVVHGLVPAIEGLGVDELVVRARLPQPPAGEFHETLVQLADPTGAGFLVRFLPPSEERLAPLSDYEQRVDRLRRRGLVYPYELIRMLTPARDGDHAEYPPGEFIEHDLDDGGLVSVDRAPGGNSASIVAGVMRHFTPKYPDGMARVALLGDPSKGLGAVAEPECRRIIAALDLAERLRLPVEWFALSSGAKIAMDSGTENMDWIARVLRRIVDFTQVGGEINVIVAGINVGAQPYWNAEATMLMHTRGILVMTPDSAMVLTGKQALDYSGGVSAEDNYGIGGYERIMGPNGQAQYWAPNMAGACRILLRHYDHTYVAPGERFPRRATTSDAVDRDVRAYPHVGSEFATIGEVFAEEANPGRKRPFDIRSVMRAAIDQDQAPLARWAGFADAESAVVWDAHVGGQPICLIGLESRPVPRRGFVPADGPDHWTSGTLFPLSSKKVARAINGASGNRPVVVLANLSGFDGSPESMGKLQLEYGAEIGRAVVNFRGPLVFCVVSRYHGGAFVVFSAALNDGLEVAALEGSFASVIGGAPAAAVVFAREVDARTERDQRLETLRQRISSADGADRAKLRSEEVSLRDLVRSEKLGEVADEFDGVHSVERALAVGSVHRILPAAQLRPYLVDAVRRGVDRFTAAADLAVTSDST